VCHVLIIEDELLIALDIEEILTRAGATSFDRVDSEQAAVAAAELRRPDLMTVDVVLRSGFGPSAVDTIAKRHGDIPTIYITATPEACRSGGHTRVLCKPVNEGAVARAYNALRPAA
jgi:two-component system, response regulator PdtaR